MKNISYNQSFSQEAPERLIKRIWESARLASSYLFFGPAGTGRLFLARRLAQAVNCSAQSFPPCGECIACRKIENNSHPDVHYTNKTDSRFIRIEQIHQLQREISLLPLEGKGKVFIISEAEDLTEEASNCLLKIIEEPPEGSLLILIASDLRRIIPTIASRCAKIKFNALDRHKAEALLQSDFRLNQSLSHWLAFALEGRLGQALSFNQGDVLGQKNKIIRCLINGAQRMPDQYAEMDRDELSWALKVLIGCIRDIYLLKSAVNPQELINLDLKDELALLARRFSFNELERMLKQLSDWLNNVRQNVNPKLLVDNLPLLWKK